MAEGVKQQGESLRGHMQACTWTDTHLDVGTQFSSAASVLSGCCVIVLPSAQITKTYYLFLLELVNIMYGNMGTKNSSELWTF